MIGRFRACTIGWLVAGLIALPAPVTACSVMGDYRVPTNLELVEAADTILLGRVESGPKAGESAGGADLVIRPTLLLKGPVLPQEVRMPGAIAEGGYAITSDPDELREAHPLSYIGACVRTLFVQGSMILLFLERKNGELRPLAYPFSRYAEDVASTEARWVKAVRIYAEAAALPENERRPALIARRAQLIAQADDADAQAIAADIGRQLAGPNRPWNDLMMEEIERRIGH